MADPLKLRAEDEEDLAVVSTILQDALVPVAEMAYLPEEKRFVLVANRFKWEAPPAPLVEARPPARQRSLWWPGIGFSSADASPIASKGEMR